MDLTGSIQNSIAAYDPGLPVTLASVGVVVLVVALTWVWLILRRRRFVAGASLAIARLADLSSTSLDLVTAHPLLQLSFGTAVNSKARFDRYNLPALMHTSLLDREQSIEREVEKRLATTRHYASYDQDASTLAGALLGQSSHPKVNTERFAAIELKLFLRQRMPYPTPQARVTTKVTYTSPKGQNSYSRQLDWDFGQLEAGLRTAQGNRARQSTAAALRQRERTRMTDRVRSTIMRRDNYQCQMCGASRVDGAKLHVDHIRPVSRDGLTEESNLQTLCEACNLGKSNLFTG